MQKVIDGLVVHMEEIGKGGQNLVIFPGWKGTVNEWLPVGEKLGEKYKVTIVELPGFGESSMPPKNWDIYKYSDCAIKILNKLGIKKAIIVGHSFGGRIGILLAARTDVAEKLVLIDAAGMEIKNLKVRLLKLFRTAAILLPEAVRNKFRSDDWREAGELKEVFSKVIGQSLAGELNKVKTPTLIIWGENDREVTLAEAKLIKSGIKDSVLRIVWGPSHWPQSEKPAELLDILREEGI